MAWLDNRLWAHPKVRNVPRAARWEYVAAVTYASGFGTGGLLTAGQLKAIECTQTDRRLLINAGLWEDAGDGSIRIHDWDEHNSKSDEKRLQDRERKRKQRQREADMSRGQERDIQRDVTRDVPRARGGGRPRDDGMTNEEGPDTTAADTPKSTSSTTEASYAEEPNTEHLEDPAAAAEGATESAILDACKRFGAEPNIAEPWARQLAGNELEAIAAKMEMKIRRGTVEHVPGHFVDLLKRQVRANVKAATHVTIHIPTLEENLETDVLAYARGQHPWDVAADLLGRKMAKLDVPAERRDDLLSDLRRVYDAHQADAA